MSVHWSVQAVAWLMVCLVGLLPGGALAQDGDEVEPAATPVLAPLTGIVAVTAGDKHTCALTQAGGVKCWGYDLHGILGNGAPLEDTALPVDVTGLTSGVIAIDAGRYFTCALMESGKVMCWGADDNGQLGNGAPIEDSPIPVEVSGLNNAVAIAGGGYHACAVLEGGGVRCWGSDTNGQLGNGAPLDESPTPVNVSALTGAAALAGGLLHTCALTDAGGVHCWGDDASGKLGNDLPEEDSPVPVGVTGLISDVASIDAGYTHTCAVNQGGGVKCWGSDLDGQLGNSGANTDSPIPVNVSNLSSGVVAVSGGDSFTCALMQTGGARCWGVDFQDELGDGSPAASRGVPGDVIGFDASGITTASGEHHTCAVTSEHKIRCWGGNGSGQLGDGTEVTPSLPKDVLAPATCYKLTRTHTGSGANPASEPANSPLCPADHYLAGTTVVLFANSNAGARVNGWTATVDDASLSSVNYLKMPATDSTVSVIYAPCRALTRSHSGGGDDPIAVPEQSINCPAGTYVTGEKVALIAKPDADQRVKAWSGADTTPDAGALVNTLSMPNAVHTVSTAYEACFALSSQVSGQGDPLVATPGATFGCAAGSYAAGASIVLSAAPAAGWKVAGWTGTANDAGTTAGNTLIMPAAGHVVGVIYAPVKTGAGTLYLPALRR